MNPGVDILADIARTPAAGGLRASIEAGGPLALPATAEGAWSLVATLVHRLVPGRPVVVVTDSPKTQESVQSDLVTWLALGGGEPARAPLYFPAWDTLPHENRLPHADVVSERLETLVRLRTAGATAPAPVVTCVAALLQRTFPSDELAGRTRRLARGDTMNPLDLIEWLEEQGYEPEAQVTHKGELAWRGGIVDVWPLSSPWPVRLEFFGDELESLREFDPQAQVSREAVERVVIPPAGELGLLRPREGAPPPVLETLLDHLPGRPVFLVLEPASVDEHAAQLAAQVPEGDRFFEAWPAFRDAALARGASWVSVSTLSTGPDPDRADLPSFESLEPFRPLGSTLPAPAVADARRREFFQQLHRWLRQGERIDVVCTNAGEVQRFGELWAEFGLGADPTQVEGKVPGLTVHTGVLGRGFRMPSAGWVVVTDAEIYGRYRVQRARRLKSAHARAVRSVFEIDFTEFEEGDFVVHLQHGIARYRGLQVLAARGRTGIAAGEGQECLVLEFATPQDGAAAPRVYVPVSEAHLVSKYVGAGKARPQLSVLGGTRWTRAKEQAQRAVRDLAAELLSVQAARTTHPGHPFAPDTSWQREFEASFEFEETPDQVRAIAAAKQDMESPRPMDRLLCGDVGFGKTEVAIRAAFKAVMGGKQVAVLVPTTVLAQQHYNNFRDRMAEYPVRIELLSRFRTAAQQRRVLEAAREGAVDIVIGTHRVVSADVGFKDLGLVIVDEEQKFGVKHKEEFKRLRQTVDVLTLSATPIPRTLYLALTGARDLSTLETPPQDRLPVETVVTDHDERVIRDAIQRELNRGGQVYFLHNRVTTIEAMALRIRDLVPSARVLVGHGQMKEHELERVMTAFVNGEADVLVSTTIIESGLDIPNANTILIDRADRFGLSELYQLRGRVGRYKRQAYAYFLLPRHARLLTEARKRMSAIKQYSALGSGFKIALRDLEIRGAGNLLGAEQSGHITAVGFDLYCQLLAQSVSALKGEPARPRVEVRTRLDFLALSPGEEAPPAVEEARRSARPKLPDIRVPRDDGDWQWVEEDDGEGSGGKAGAEEPDPGRTPCYLPLDYIREAPQRVEVYRKLAQATEPAHLEALAGELRDRFGPVPPAVELMFQLAGLRLVAAGAGVTSIEVENGKLKLTRGGDLLTVGGQFPRLQKRTASDRLREIRRFITGLRR